VNLFLSQRASNLQSHSPPHPFQKNNPHSPHYQNETTVPKKEFHEFDIDEVSNLSLEMEVGETAKRIQLEEQFKQKIDELTKIEALRTRLNQIEKYRFHWFNTLLELEYLLYGENKKNGFNIKFSKVEKIPQSATSFILKNPSRYIPPSIEDIADLSLQLHFGSETKNVLIEAVNVFEVPVFRRKTGTSKRVHPTRPP
jgi:hypothetical protein